MAFFVKKVVLVLRMATLNRPHDDRRFLSPP